MESYTAADTVRSAAESATALSTDIPAEALTDADEPVITVKTVTLQTVDAVLPSRIARS